MRAVALREEFKTTVADFPWEDEETVIMGNVASWRAWLLRARWGHLQAQVEQTKGLGYPVDESEYYSVW